MSTNTDKICTDAQNVTDGYASCAPDSPDSPHDLVRAFRFLWGEYVLVDKETLTEDAKKLRQELLDIVADKMQEAYHKGSEDGIRLFRQGFDLGFGFVRDFPSAAPKKQKSGPKVIRVKRPKSQPDGN